MTLTDHYIETALTPLRRQIANIQPPELSSNTLLDRYMALSLLQKAIRRDEFDLAWQASSYLLENFPAHFWKRLAIIALEDVGIADLDVVLATLILSAGENTRVQLGGCLRVASVLVRILCHAKKDRSTDDLFDVVTRDPDWINETARYAEVPFEDLSQFRIPPIAGVHETAVALSVFAGCDGEIPSGNLRKRAWSDAMAPVEEHVWDPKIGVIAQEGLRVTGSILAPMLLSVGKSKKPATQTVNDPLPTPEIVNGLPVWIAGMHTRVGLDGFRRYIRMSGRMAQLLKTTAFGNISNSKIVGALVFRLDCGQLKNRLDWSLATELKSQAMRLGWGIPDEVVPEALNILINEFELLNRCRAEALSDHLS